MCGFVGYLGRDVQFTNEDGEAVLQRMADKIVTRGPDDAGYWCSAAQQVGLGHRRRSFTCWSPAYAIGKWSICHCIQW